MLSINLGRGLFRLWIVASFVWLVIVGAFVQEDIRRDVSRLTTDRSAEITRHALAERLPRPRIDWAARLRLRELEEEDRKARARTKQLIEGRLQATLPPGFVLETDELRASLLAGTEDTRTPSQLAQGNLMFAASFLLLPPILAFALGWAGLWIVRGFRS